MQTPFPCLWHLKSSLDAQSLHCDANSSEKSSQFLYPLHWLFTFSQMLTPFFLHKKRWSSEQLLQMCVNHQHNLRHCRLRIWEYTWQTGKFGRRSRLENWHKIARQIHRRNRKSHRTDNLHSYKCQRHFFYTRRGGRQRNCYSVWQNCASDHWSLISLQLTLSRWSRRLVVHKLSQRVLGANGEEKEGWQWEKTMVYPLPADVICEQPLMLQILH